MVQRMAAVQAKQEGGSLSRRNLLVRRRNDRGQTPLSYECPGDFGAELSWREEDRNRMIPIPGPWARRLASGKTAQFWVESVEQEASAQGIFLFVTTDQVRFGRPLEQVPRVVFSEVMRDVDLFVGVASVGNDPTWNEGGPEGRYLHYWEQHAFGDLDAAAVNRKEVLQRLSPKLSIADQCSFEGRFLVVKGNLRTYKIHLGSANILMEPNDQYLCIVPKLRKTGETRAWLPFEGDRTLSIILSKAFLLAQDNQIMDESILRQIRSGRST